MPGVPEYTHTHTHDHMEDVYLHEHTSSENFLFVSSNKQITINLTNDIGDSTYTEKTILSYYTTISN